MNGAWHRWESGPVEGVGDEAGPGSELQCAGLVPGTTGAGISRELRHGEGLYSTDSDSFGPVGHDGAF